MAKRSIKDRIRTAFRAKDEAALEEELGELNTDNEEATETPEQRLVIKIEGPDKPVAETPSTDEDPREEENPVLKAIDDLKTMLGDLAARVGKLEAGGEGNGDPVADAGEGPVDEPNTPSDPHDGQLKDAMPLKTQFNEVVSKAEILAPGIRLPVFDAKADRKMMADAMCGLRRKALSRAFADEMRKPHVIAAVGSDKPDFAKMTCDTATVAFNAASELVRRSLNADVARDQKTTPANGPMTPARYQAMIEERRKVAR